MNVDRNSRVFQRFKKFYCVPDWHYGDRRCLLCNGKMWLQRTIYSGYWSALGPQSLQSHWLYLRLSFWKLKSAIFYPFPSAIADMFASQTRQMSRSTVVMLYCISRRCCCKLLYGVKRVCNNFFVLESFYHRPTTGKVTSNNKLVRLSKQLTILERLQSQLTNIGAKIRQAKLPNINLNNFKSV